MLTLLRDITGGRRFWPVKTPGDTKLKPWDIDDVDQIWSEVMEYYHQGQSLILSNKAEEFANAAQVDALESDDREGLVKEYLDILLPTNWDDVARDMGYDKRWIMRFHGRALKEIDEILKETIKSH